MAENPIHARPAAKGDICVLLESTRTAEHRRLQQHQCALRARFGGELINHVHLTAQRFACPDPQQLQGFIAQLEQALTGVQPFELDAMAMQTLYVAGMHTNFLKWRVEITNDLENLSRIIERELVAAGITPLYVPGTTSTLVSALRNVPDLPEPELVTPEPFPFPLFTVETLIFSRIESPTAFSNLTEIRLDRQ
ncbi:MAG: hypothetical protein JXA21_17420 [Anaerolineae bacterium]|nr:hypothetical protein [Anaerolineae bacterium]